jgi:hypothetical protein
MYAENTIKAFVRPEINKVERFRTNAKRVHMPIFPLPRVKMDRTN